jgi:Zn-dependent protease with chaperone function
MTPFRARHYNGRTADAHSVLVSVDTEGTLSVTSDSGARRYPLAAVTAEPPLGHARRFLLLPDGSTCEYQADAVDQEWLHLPVPGTGAAFECFDRRPLLATLAAILVVGTMWGVLSWGAGTVARVAALRIPPSAESGVGQSALASADRSILRPSQLPPATRNQIAANFRRLTAGLPHASCFHLSFRNSQILGANALALPGCNIVLLDPIVLLAEHPDEITAVLAHEIGHVRERHAMRQALHGSMVLMLLSLVTGDVPSGALLLVSAPGAALQAAYSRDLEREADDVAIELLARRGIPATRLTDLLVRVEAWQASGDPRPTFLSTHPPTSQRVRQLLRTGERESPLHLRLRGEKRR